MENKFTILGCGSSLGSPWITNYWGSCKINKKNTRTRCSAHFSFENMSILIDTSPDIKQQFRDNNLKDIDAVLYTHAHSDQISGIFELRPFFWKNKQKINIYGSSSTINELKIKYDFCFIHKLGYVPILKANVINKKFIIKKNSKSINIKSFEAQHGLIKSSIYIFKKIAYMSDCNHVPDKYIKDLYGLNYLILDCLRKKPHSSHFNLDQALSFANKVNAKKTILTNLHVDLDYNELKKKLPKNIIPAYDGLSFNY